LPLVVRTLNFLFWGGKPEDSVRSRGGDGLGCDWHVWGFVWGALNLLFLVVLGVHIAVLIEK